MREPNYIQEQACRFYFQPNYIPHEKSIISAAHMYGGTNHSM